MSTTNAKNEANESIPYWESAVANTLSPIPALSHGKIEISMEIGMMYRAMIRQVTLRTAIGILLAGSLHSPAARPMISVPWKFTRMMTMVMPNEMMPASATFRKMFRI